MRLIIYFQTMNTTTKISDEDNIALTATDVPSVTAPDQTTKVL